jgi:HlyD family secretion protein
MTSQNPQVRRPADRSTQLSAFGPQGADLIRELRRVESFLGHAPHEGARKAAPERPTNDGRRTGTVRHLPDPRRRPPVNSITNIHPAPITELRPRRAASEQRINTAPNIEIRHQERQSTAPARSPSWHRMARLWRDRLIAGCGYLFGAPHASEARADQQADLAGRLRNGLDRELRSGIRVLVLGLGLTGGWAVLVPLAAAVTLPGSLVVESNVKKIQYPAGGVIAQIQARDGMHVKEGDLLVRLDETQLRANLQVVSDQLDETRVRIARLTAERDGFDEPKIPPDWQAKAGQDDVARLFASEKTLFKARLSTRESQKRLLQSNITQLEDQIGGIEAQIKSKSEQLDLFASELKGVQALFDKQLVPLTRLTALQRQAAQLNGERSQLQSAIAEARSKINQAELEIVKIDQDLRSEVMKDLREAQDKESELKEKLVAAQDQVKRIEIRAPNSGTVHQLSVHTVGGVIGAGEVIMEIVPDSDDLQIEAKLPPIDIDQVHVGQDVQVRFSAFNQRTTPQIEGTVSYVSADLTEDPQSKSSSYYTVRVKLTSDARHRLGRLRLVSGMPAEVFLQTGSRTMMSYLLKPLTDQLHRTFNER